jgi:hypothetical protein
MVNNKNIVTKMVFFLIFASFETSVILFKLKIFNNEPGGIKNVTHNTIGT